MSKGVTPRSRCFQLADQDRKQVVSRNLFEQKFSIWITRPTCSENTPHSCSPRAPALTRRVRNSAPPHTVGIHAPRDHKDIGELHADSRMLTLDLNEQGRLTPPLFSPLLFSCLTSRPLPFLLPFLPPPTLIPLASQSHPESLIQTNASVQEHWMSEIGPKVSSFEL
jgi:hypothetical protein